MSARRWAIVAGEYPPDFGGVADYTQLVAEALVAAGDEVTVFAPGRAARASGGVRVVRLHNGFLPHGLGELRRRILESRPQRILVQYVAQSFGVRAVNLPLVFLLRSLAAKTPLWVMFHEFAIAHHPKLGRARAVQAFGTRLMARLTVGRAARLMVSTAAWVPRIHAFAPRAAIDVVPIPSNLPTHVLACDVAPLRERLAAPGMLLVGHFGTYRMTESRASLRRIVPDILAGEPNATFVLLGRDGDRFAAELQALLPALAARIVGTGELDRESAALHLAGCDVLVQPYAEGVTTRRGSLLAGLALGVPTVSTFGDLSEDVWRGCEALAFARSVDPADVSAKGLELLRDPAARTRMSYEARRFYAAHFALERTLEQLRQA